MLAQHPRELLVRGRRRGSGIGHATERLAGRLHQPRHAALVPERDEDGARLRVAVAERLLQPAQQRGLAHAPRPHDDEALLGRLHHALEQVGAAEEHRLLHLARHAVGGERGGEQSVGEEQPGQRLRRHPRQRQRAQLGLAQRERRIRRRDGVGGNLRHAGQHQHRVLHRVRRLLQRLLDGPSTGVGGAELLGLQEEQRQAAIAQRLRRREGGGEQVKARGHQPGFAGRPGAHQRGDRLQLHRRARARLRERRDEPPPLRRLQRRAREQAAWIHEEGEDAQGRAARCRGCGSGTSERTAGFSTMRASSARGRRVNTRNSAMRPP